MILSVSTPVSPASATRFASLAKLDSYAQARQAHETQCKATQDESYLTYLLTPRPSLSGRLKTFVRLKPRLRPAPIDTPLMPAIGAHPAFTQYDLLVAVSQHTEFCASVLTGTLNIPFKQASRMLSALFDKGLVQIQSPHPAPYGHHYIISPFGKTLLARRTPAPAAEATPLLRPMPSPATVTEFQKIP